MNLWERFTTAASVLLSGKTAYEFTNTWQQGQPAYTSGGFTRNVVHGYRKNELIYSCVALKADSAATPVLRVYRKRDDVELPEHPLRRLLRKPNPFMSDFDFIAITLMLLDLAGRTVWEKQRSGGGRVVGLWPLRPDWLLPVLGPGGLPSAYEYHAEGKIIPMLSQDVLEFKVWDPLNLYDGLAPVSVAGRVGDVDNAATDYLKKFFDQGGIPPGILSSKLKLTDPAVADIRRRWKERYGGWQNWTEPAVLDSDAAYQQTGMSFKDMGFDVLDGRSEARICAVLRTPAILVGAKVGLDRATYSNYGEARKAYWQDDLTPQYRRLADELNNDLAGEFGDDVELRWDFSQVPALQEDQTAVWERAGKALERRGITVNEYREAIGKPKMPGSEYDKLPAAPAPLALPPAKEPPAEEAEDEPTEEAPRKILRYGQARKTAEDAPDADERRKAEKALQKDMESYFERQRKRIVEVVG